MYAGPSHDEELFVEHNKVLLPTSTYNLSLFLPESFAAQLFECTLHSTHTCTSFSRTKVVWSSGNRVQKSFTLKLPILQAIWCYFSDENLASSNPTRNIEKKARSLCVLQSEMVTVYAPDGEIYSVALPCKVMFLLASPLLLSACLLAFLLSYLSIWLSGCLLPCYVRLTCLPVLHLACQ